MAPENVPDPRAVVQRLDIKDLFDSLPPKDKLYAHYLSKAAWKGSRIILRQTSPESEQIFDLIISLSRSCNDEWAPVTTQSDITEDDMKAFLAYAGLFLYNLGNYYGGGGHKFVPDLPQASLRNIARRVISETTVADNLVNAILETPPNGLGYPSETALSNYYLGLQVSRDEIATVSKVMEAASIELENTRLRKIVDNDENIFEVLQASAEIDVKELRPVPGSDIRVRLVRGDRSEEMGSICKQ